MSAIAASVRIKARIRELLCGTGLRCTRARALVLEHLSARGRPQAHSEIAKGRRTAGLDRVTLYRTLSTLEEAGLVHRVQDHDGAWRFCAHVRLAKGCPGNHPHFQCTRCGRMQCLTAQALPWVSVPKDALVTGKQFLIYGLCPKCAPTLRGK